jgi:N-acetylneuraminic acid mutarotase
MKQIDFNAVDVFDIDSYLQSTSSNGTWYQQNTTGDIPQSRIDFCTVAVSAPDNSSHHIYMYGGIDPITSTMYDDVYVLSLPSFTWTAVYTDGGSPRWGHNCHLANGRQMVTVGGVSANQSCTHQILIV